MTDVVVFDAEPLIAHAFDEPGADAVDEWLDGVYRKEAEGRIATPNLAELRYVIARSDSPAVADEYVTYLWEVGVVEQGVDALWTQVSELKLQYNPSLGDAYALAAASHLHDEGNDVVLLVGADDDFDSLDTDEPSGDLIERFREDGA